MYETLEKVRMIWDMLKTTYFWQKIYSSNWIKDVEFEVCDRVYFEFSTMKGVMRFFKKANLTPYIVGSFEIVKFFGKISYGLNLQY